MSQLNASQTPPQLLRFGDLTLYKMSVPFDLPNEMPLAHQTFRLMEEATQNLGNVGIAAPQIGILRRIVMFEIPAKHPRYKTDGIAIPMRALINPSYKPLSEEQNFEWEACLSIPGMMGQVPRYTHIEYRYTDLEGNHHEYEVSDFHARVVQHELDHLDGILYPLRIKDMRTFGFREEVLTSPAFLQSRQ